MGPTIRFHTILVANHIIQLGKKQKEPDLTVPPTLIAVDPEPEIDGGWGLGFYDRCIVLIFLFQISMVSATRQCIARLSDRSKLSPPIALKALTASFVVVPTLNPLPHFMPLVSRSRVSRFLFY